MKINAQSFVQFSVACTLLLLTACASLKKDNQQEMSWSLELKKGGCMDVCSSYNISITNTGEYNYSGRFQVKHLGEKTGKLKKSNINELQGILQSIGWENLNTSYGQNAEGAGRKELYYNTQDIQKKITYYRLEPQEIRRLENYLDILINHDEF